MVVISDTDLRISGGAGQGGSPPGRRIVEEALERGAGALDEARAKALLAEYGMMVTPGALVYDVDEAVHVAQDLGYPVVMKGVSPGILHKSDVGLVLVDVRDEDAVRGGHELLCKRSDGGLEAVLVERMIPSGRELVAGRVQGGSSGRSGRPGAYDHYGGTDGTGPPGDNRTGHQPGSHGRR